MRVATGKVLILVLMEDTLRAIPVLLKCANLHVLILVLMEDTLRVLCTNIYTLFSSLNPCFNGRYSQSQS